MLERNSTKGLMIENISSIPDILFINPAHHGPDYYSPIGINMLMAIAKSAGLTADILDFQRMVIGREIVWPENFLAAAESLLRTTRARIFGFTIMNVGFPWALELASIVRRHHSDSTVVFGGPHATLLARQILELYPQVDIVMVNEGEKAIIPLVESVLGGKDLSECPNIFFRTKDGEIARTRGAALLEELDTLPLMALDEELLARSAMISVEAGRGCPYRCKFCSSHAIWTRTPRFKSAHRLVDEAVTYVNQAGARADSLLISFEHDDFISNRPWFREFVAYKQSIGATFCYAITTRINHLTEEVVQLLVASDCISVFMGLETGSERLQTTSAKHLDLGKLAPALRGLREARIHFSSNFIVGFPGETIDDVAATVGLALCLAWLGSTINISMMCPEPGSEIHAATDPSEYRLLLDGNYANELRRGGIDPEGLHEIARYHLVTIANSDFDIIFVDRVIRSIQYLITTFPNLLFEVYEFLGFDPYTLLMIVWAFVEDSGPINEQSVNAFANATPRKQIAQSEEFLAYERARAAFRRGKIPEVASREFGSHMPHSYYARLDSVAELEWSRLNVGG